VLLDDNFVTIVRALRQGRTIYDNLSRAVRYVLAVHVPITGLALLPLLATQILWINLLTDAGPALALGVEPADRGVMRRPPRDPRRGVITPAMWWDIAFVGLVMGAGTLLVLDGSLPGGLLAGSGTLAYARTMTFTTLVCFQLFNVFNARFLRRSAAHRLLGNRWLWLAVALSLLLQIAAVHLPPLRPAFGTVPLTPGDWAVCAAVGSGVVWLTEVKKLLLRAFDRRGAARRAEASGNR
jgi:Ca2+-transporting ATPase